MKGTVTLTITIMILILCFYLIEETTVSRYPYKTAFLKSSKKILGKSTGELSLRKVNGFQNSFFSEHLQIAASVIDIPFAKI